MSNKLPYAGYVAYKVRELPKEEQQIERGKYYGTKTRADRFLEYMEYCRTNGLEAEKAGFPLPEKELSTGLKVAATGVGFLTWFTLFTLRAIGESVKRGKYY
jgi:hypothetical protein